MIERIIGYQGPGVYKIIDEKSDQYGEVIQVDEPTDRDDIQVYPWFNEGVTYRTLEDYRKAHKL